MKIKIKRLALAILVAAIVGWAGGAWAENGACGEDDSARFEKAQRFDKIVDELKLSPAQQEALNKQRSNLAVQSNEARTRLRSTREALKAELDKPNPDMSRVNALTSDMQGLVNRQIQNRVNNVVEMKQVLTTEQFSKMRSLVEERKNQYRDRRFDRSQRRPRF